MMVNGRTAARIMEKCRIAQTSRRRWNMRPQKEVSDLKPDAERKPKGFKHSEK